MREAARWHLQDRAGRLSLGEVARMARIGREEGVVQIWDFMHYGYPDDLDPLATPGKFVDRFARYAGAVARVISNETPQDLVTYYTPVNEISYYSWTGGQMGTMAPFAQGRGGELKRVLVRAALAATEAIGRPTRARSWSR